MLCKVSKLGTLAHGTHLHGCPWSGPDTCPLLQQNSVTWHPGTCCKIPQLQAVTSKRPPKASQVNSQNGSYNPQALTNRNDRRTDQRAQTQVSLCSFWSWEYQAAQWASGNAVNAEGAVPEQKQCPETQNPGQCGLWTDDSSITEHYVMLIPLLWSLWKYQISMLWTGVLKYVRQIKWKS